jgi:hypothetical protein
MHIRQQLRNAVGNALVLIPELNGRVYMSRVYPFSTESLPGVNIAFVSENIQEDDRANVLAGREIFRNCTFEVTVNLMGQDSDNEFDDLAALIETAIYTGAEIRCLAKDWILSSTEIEVLPEAEDPVTIGRMQWDFLYANVDTNPEVAR